MSNHIGEVGKRIELTVTLVREYRFESYFGYNQTTTIYTMEDADGNILVWKTNGYMWLETVNARGDIDTDFPRKGDEVTIRATVKEHGEYKGEQQTVLSRVKVTGIVHAPTKAELDAARAKEQLASLADGDFLWRMPYKQYKDHYEDCETVAGSFRRSHGESTIEVIIRAGRLVPSGVRGKHYSGYQFKTDNNVLVCYRAIREETARRQLLKDFPNGRDWPCVKIFDYRRNTI